MEPEIIEKIRNAMAESEVKEIIQSREQVLERFTPAFLPNAVGNLDEDDFRQFLSFKHNKHWSNLERQKNRLCEDMSALRKTLAVLVDEHRPINRRVDDVLRLRGMGEGTLSAILLVAYPDKYGVWNSTSEKVLRDLGLWPSTPRGASKGDKYAAVNRVLVEIAHKLGVDLWTLDALWWRVEADGAGAAKASGLGHIRTGDSKAKAIANMRHSILATVKNANGQAVERTMKNKELKMLDRELDALLPKLIDAQGERCNITGIPFQYEGDKNMLPSADRIDSKGHYEEANLQVVCQFVNFWKGATPDAEFRRLIQVVRELGKADIGQSAE